MDEKDPEGFRPVVGSIGVLGAVVAPPDAVTAITIGRKAGLPTALMTVLKGEVVDSTFMSAKALDAFLAETLAQAKADDVLYSVHLKATMMKVSDPVLFGHVVRAFFKDVFDKHGAALDEAGLTPEQDAKFWGYVTYAAQFMRNA